MKSLPMHLCACTAHQLQPDMSNELFEMSDLVEYQALFCKEIL